MKSIFVTFQVEGIHCYPDAPPGVEFLRHPHRHIFHYRVMIEVNHNERDIEFILFKRELQGLFTFGVMSAESRSCESLAEELAGYILEKYPKRALRVEVSEDGENGAVISYGAEKK